MSTDSLLGPPATLAHLLTDLQSKGLRVEASMEARHGGAGPSDSGMLWIEGVPVTVPTVSAQAHASPDELADAAYTLRPRGTPVVRPPWYARLLG